MAFRIDEFTKTPDGAIGTRDRVRLASVGFDLPSILGLSLTISYHPDLLFHLSALAGLAFTIEYGWTFRIAIATGPSGTQQPVLLIGQ